MIVVVGLAFEARIAAGDGIRVICSGDGRHLTEKLTRMIRKERGGLVSFGVAGGLASDLRPGACVIASEVMDGGERYATDRAWSRQVLEALPDAVHGPMIGVNAPVAHPHAKRSLHRETGAIAVDMESHVVARVAAEHRLPMIAIRVVTDPAERALPQCALVGARPDGSTSVGAVMRALTRRPHEFPALLRVALDTRAARATLLRSREVLSRRPTLGVPDLGELGFDVA
jgi:adenosylhomocysteine nucleosidase